MIVPIFRRWCKGGRYFLKKMSALTIIVLHARYLSSWAVRRVCTLIAYFVPMQWATKTCRKPEGGGGVDGYIAECRSV